MSQSNPTTQEPTRTAQTTTTADTASTETTSLDANETAGNPLGDDILRRTEFMDLVKSDPTLDPVEQELTMRIAADQNEFVFHSECKGFSMQAFLHEAVTITEIHVRNDDDERTKHEFTDELDPDDLDGVITAVKGRFPVGALSLNEIERDHDRLSGVMMA